MNILITYRQICKSFLLILLVLAESAFGNTGNQVSVSMGTTLFSWTFDKNLEYGYFVDGQPWIVVPTEGVKLLSVYPSRINNANVYNTYTGVPTVADINITVLNPHIGTYYQDNAGPIIINNAFGWDSRGAIRYATTSTTYYDSTIGWNGITPLSLIPGDVLTTAKSLTDSLKGVETVLDAVAVLTVLSSAPPADAFRPGVVRSALRKTNPQFFTLSQLIDLNPYLINQPTTSIFGSAISTVPDVFNATRLTNLMPGPSILIEGLNNGRSFKCVYNDSGCTYGANHASFTGELAIGALASWLTPIERKQCQINLIQRAIDVYETLLAGCVLTHNGGHLPGNGVLLTIAGKMLNSEEMLSINQSINNREPFYYLGDYSQMIYVAEDNVEEENTPALNSVRRVNLANISTPLHNLTIPTSSISSNAVTINPTFEWPGYRSARAVINSKLRIESGAGAGSQYYVVTGISNYTDLDGNAGSTGTSQIMGGVLTIKPAWVNGTPDANSTIKLYTVVSSETPCWAFKSAGLNSSNGQYYQIFDLAPTTDYGEINVGAYVSYLCVLYALNAQSYYTSGIDRWIINALKIPGYGAYLFSTSSTRYLMLTNGDNKIPGSSFLSGIWRDQVLNKVNLTNFSTDYKLSSLPVPNVNPVMGRKSENAGIFELYANSDGFLTYSSSLSLQKIEIYSLEGKKIQEILSNNSYGVINLTTSDNQVIVVKAMFNDHATITKTIATHFK